MKIIRNAVRFAVLLLLLSGAGRADGQYNSAVFADGELLVKYKSAEALTAAPAADDSATDASAKAVRMRRAAPRLNAQIGSIVLEEFPSLGWQRVRLPADLPLKRAVAAYQANEEVELAQPNFYYHLLNTSNDARFSELYGLEKIAAPAAWELSVGSQAVVIANIDTGIDYRHEDLAPNMWRNAGETPGNGIDDDGNGFVDDYHGYDFFYADSDPTDDAGGHGTHTAGTMGAAGNNEVGIVGVNWRVQLMAIKIYSPNGGDTTSAMLIRAYDYIGMMKRRGVNIRVTNNSYGGCGEACGYDQATKDAIDALGEAGILQVFAAGNSGRDIERTPFYPASYTSPSILTVAAADQTDNRAGFSNYGASSVDVAAPGVGILSAFNTSRSAYASLSGTSMATPHVSGAAALLSAYNPSLTAASLKATLMNTADELVQWSGVVKTGGRLNVGRALRNQTVCAFGLTTTERSVSAAGGEYNLEITAANNCDYSIVSGAGWIMINKVGSGNGTFTYSVEANSGAARTGIISVAGQTFTVTQAAAALTYEADVAPRGAGDGAVSSTDVSIIQGFQLGLGAPYQSNEFQRADCSPFETRGDGQISSIDVSQAQAYQLGLNRTVENTLQSASDPLARLAAAGANASPLFSLLEREQASGESSNQSTSNQSTTEQSITNESTRRVRVGLMTGVAGQTITIPIEVDALGDESVYGFSIGYDAAKLSNPSVVIGNAGGAVLSNAREAGRIGVSVGFGGGVIAAGTGKVLINVRLTIAANAEAGASALRLTDEPTIREVASGAESAGGVRRLASEFVDGAVTITAGGKSRKRARFF